MKSIDVKQVLSLVMTVVTYVTSQDPGKVIQGIGTGLTKEVVAIKHPIDETVINVAASQCDNAKKLFGLTYEQLEGEREPDVNALTLVFKTRLFSSTFRITNAAVALRELRAFKLRDKLVIFVHGFTDDPSQGSFTNISESFLHSDEGEHVTLLALDGSSLIRWLYLRSTTYVVFMGQKLAEMFTVLVNDGLEPSQIHIVGHSLGAHVAGYAGKEFHLLTGKKIGRISGLDPAGPCFTKLEPHHRLHHSDADYVDVIHSDAGVFGIKTTVGHANYLPNSGAEQPDCLLQTCSHSRAWLLYGESIIRLDAFPAVRCDNWESFTKGQCSDEEISYMGYASQPGTRGTFCLQTGGTYPYGLGIKGIKYTNNEGLVRNVQGAVSSVPVLRKLPVVGYNISF